jgi:4-amino-4-deoxy-L-arabinose transferase-like glycosyltransferase
LLAWWGSAVLLFFMARHYIDQKQAILASLFLLTFGDILFYGSVNSGEIDLFFSSLILVQGIAIFHFGERQQWGLLFLASYLFTALAVLTKGLPAAAFQVFGLLAYALSSKQWKWLFSGFHVLGIVGLTTIVGGYLYAYAQQESLLPFLSNLLKETTQRTAAENTFGETLKESLVFFPNLFKLLLPWSLLIFALIKKEVRQQVLANSLLRFAFFFVLTNIWIYVISPDGFNRYLYPFFPFIALLLAALFFRVRPNWYRGVLIGMCCIAVLRIGYNAFGMPHQQRTLKNLIYRDLNATLLQLTANEPIYWTGEPYQWTANPSLFGYELGEAQLQTPPLLPYQIPYYLSHTNNYIMAHHEQPQPNTFYLAYLDFVEGKEVEILHQFQERWTKREMVLIQFLEGK